MDENDFEAVVTESLKAFAGENDLPMEVVTIREKGFGKEAGVIVRLGGNEFHMTITQTVFEDS